MMQQALVTGATGFLGQHLVRRLLTTGTRVTVLHRTPSPASNVILVGLEESGATIVRCSDYDEVRAVAAALAPDCTFHLATRYLRDHIGTDIEELLDANIAFGTHLMEGLSGTKSAVVSAMSFFQFRQNEPASYSLYSATKQAFSDISRYYRDVRELDLREVILYDTFGPGDTRDKLIPRLLEAVARNESVSMGPERQELNLLYVSDVVAGLIAAAGPHCAPTVALKASRNITVGQLVMELESVVGRPLDKHYRTDASVNDLVTAAGTWDGPPGWEPQETLKRALRSTYDWHRRSRTS